MTAEISGRSEADDASRGSAIRLAAEVSSRLVLLATTLLLLRQLSLAEYGLYTQLSIFALLLAEVGELGLQVLASRALVASSLSLASLVRARLLLTGLVAAVAIAAIPFGPRLVERSSSAAPAGSGVVLSLLVVWFALSGWGEFTGVALRCRGARGDEALLLLALRLSALAGVAVALASGARLRGVAAGLALSPLPALALGAWLVRRRPAPEAAPSVGPIAVLRASAPLAVYAALLLLSPRVDVLVLSRLRDDRQVGLFSAALLVVWFLAMVPGAISSGAMPALTREALRGDGAVRRRTAATLALLAAPAAVGLFLLAPAAAAEVLLRRGLEAADYAGVALPLRVLAGAVPALFMNGLVAASLNAAGHAAWLPRLMLGRIALALALALALVPSFGGLGAAVGFVCAEWSLLGLGAWVCRRVGFPVPLVEPLAWGLVASVPMGFAVSGVSGHLSLALAIGALSWLATLAAALGLAPGSVRRLLGDLRYP